MEDYIKSTKQKIKQLEGEINSSSANPQEKRNMQHSLSKINIFSDDVFDDAIRLKSKIQSLSSRVAECEEEKNKLILALNSIINDERWLEMNIETINNLLTKQ